MTKIFLFGSPDIEVDGASVSIDRKKTVALLAYLVVEGGSLGREQLSSLLWPDMDRPTALASLRRSLFSLRQVLGEEILRVERKVLEFKLGPDSWVDVLELQRHREASRKLLSDSVSVTPETLKEFVLAAALYRGEFLAGFEIEAAEEFEEWMTLQRQRYLLVASDLLESIGRAYLTESRGEEAVGTARAWLKIDSYSEEAHRLLMRGLALSGRRSEALRHFEHCRDLLKNELQIAPEPETLLLFQQIRDGSIETQKPGLDRTAEKRPQKLPQPSTPFVGRFKELRHLAERLEDPNCRILTLLGPGGIGKTRLSVEAGARNAESFADGVYFVPLADAATAEAALDGIIQTLDIHSGVRSDPLLYLAGYLREKKALLILDNMEQADGAAGALAELIQRTEFLKLLVTSRHRLPLQGQWLFHLQGLDFPVGDPELDFEEYSAIELYLRAARRVRADFSLDRDNVQTVIEICRAVGGLPLGIELSAAWVRALSSDQILAELKRSPDFLAAHSEDLPGRHQSVKTVFDQSMEMLTEEERGILCRLSVFRGGFTMAGAEQVAGASLTVLVALLDKSLVMREQLERYEMHELLRQYAYQRLQGEPEEFVSTSERHAVYMAELLSSNLKPLLQGAQVAALEKLRREGQNIRSAWIWAVQQKQEAILERGLEGLYHFLFMASRLEEGIALFGDLAGEVNEESLLPLKARMRSKEAFFCIATGSIARAERALEEALPLLEKIGDLSYLAFALAQSSSLSFLKGEYEEARASLTRALGLYEETDDMEGVADCGLKLGRVEGATGHYDEARQWLLKSRQLFRQANNWNGQARALINLGNAASLSGNYVEAIRLYQESFELFTRLGERRGMAMTLANLGLAHEGLGDHEKAHQQTRQGLELVRQIGDLESQCRVLESLARICLALGKDEEAREALREGLRISTSINATPTALLLLNGVAQVLMEKDRNQRAMTILSYVWQHPKVSEEAHSRAGELMEEIRGRLSADQESQALEASENIDVDQVLSEIP